MEKILLHKIKFGSFVKLFFLGGIGLGAITGTLILIIALAGGSASANIGDIHLTGIPAGIAGFFLAPLTFACVLAWFAILGYLPFKLILRIRKGIWLTALVTTDSEEADAAYSAEA